MSCTPGSFESSVLFKMDENVVSSFFCSNCDASERESISDRFLDLIDELNNSLESFSYPSNIESVYNPTIYARQTFEMYVRKYCNSSKPIMYFGMNPGPWGMSQTGCTSEGYLVKKNQLCPLRCTLTVLVQYVPFGEVSSVRDWMGIQGPVGKPTKELAARPIKGFECTRTEISGKRFWGLFKDICGTPETFFKTSFVYNYIPQQWLKKNGCNLTPGDFKVSQMEELFGICDPIFVKVLELYEVEVVVAVGKFCETRAQKAIQKYLSRSSSSIKVVYLPHPSPRTVNNNNWNQKALEHLEKLNLLQFYQKNAT